MEDYQKRVLDEKVELSKKIDKLQIFLTDAAVQVLCSRHEYFLLRLQISAMRQYRDILLMRIESFL